jgi:hypothetical protein
VEGAFLFMKTVYHHPPGYPRPKRGDLFQSNVGKRQERTWLVLSVHTLPTRWCAEMGIVAERSRVWAERWWEIEPATRVRLFQSAERQGGQLVHYFLRFPAKKRKRQTFEGLMRLHGEQQRDMYRDSASVQNSETGTHETRDETDA